MQSGAERGPATPQERTLSLPTARLSWRMRRGNPLSRKIAAADVKMKYRFNTCAFQLTNHAPNTGDSQHRCQLRFTGRKGQPGTGGQVSLPTNSSPAVFSVAWNLKQRPGCRLSCSRSIQGDDDTALPSHHWLPAHTCWLLSGAGGLRLKPTGEGAFSVCTDLTIVLERPGWLQPQLVTWGCYPEQSVSQTRVGGYATATSLPRAPRAIEQLSNRFLLSYVCAFSQRFAQLLRVGWR